MPQPEPASRPRTVLIADDHQLVRSGLRLIVTALPGFEVVGEAADGREALALARRLLPDVLLIDLSMPVLNGLEAIPLLRRHCPDTRVVVLSMHTGAQQVALALRAGAAGYLVKDAAVAQLSQALAAVVAGQTFISPQVADAARAALAEPDGAATNDLARLTQRQREILQLVAEGHSTKEIADRLFISVKTVETHRADIMRRLETHDVAGLTRLAIRCGLVSPEA